MHLSVVALFLAACGAEYVHAPDLPPPPDATPLPPAGPTWYDDVGPVIRARCSGCHQPGAIAPFSLLGLDDARDKIGKMLVEIDAHRMPPYYADAEPDCTQTRPWRGDPRMTTSERALLGAWLDADLPAGDPRPLPDPPKTDLVDPSLTLTGVEPFLSSGDRDQFACYLFDPQLTRTRYITALQVRPGLPALIHHADLTVVSPAQAPGLIAAHGLGHPYSCGAAPGAQIHNWAPGNEPLTFPDGVAVPLRPGALIGVQYHYHPVGVGGLDATAIDLALSDEVPRWTFVQTEFGNAATAPQLLPGDDDPSTGPAFVIPANRADHVETQVFTVSWQLAGARFADITPHAHMLATHIRATIDRFDGVRDCLATGRWNFDWQRTYDYGGPVEALPPLDSGDVITVTCHFDNSFTNPNMPRVLHDLNLVAPHDVSLGANTTDEMCIANVGIVFPNPALPVSVSRDRGR